MFFLETVILKLWSDSPFKGFERLFCFAVLDIATQRSPEPRAVLVEAVLEKVNNITAEQVRQ